MPPRTARIKPGGRLKVKGRRRFVNGSDPDHLTMVRCLPCLVCGKHGETEPHHVRSKATGGTDRETVPLCHKHHMEGHTIGWRSFGKKYGVNLMAIAERLAESYEGE